MNLSIYLSVYLSIYLSIYRSIVVVVVVVLVVVVVVVVVVKLVKLISVYFFDISTSKKAQNRHFFYTFDFQMCFAPQRRALFRHFFDI